MKKPLLSILLVILCLLMTGCHKEKEAPIRSSIVTRIDIPFADQVAAMAQCTMDAIAKANGLDGEPGADQMLLIPVV